MGHPLRWFVPGIVYESTIRTIQERFLLRPSAVSRDIILGILGRAQTLYPDVRLHAFIYLSNHSHLMLSGEDGERMAAFIGFVNGNVAREMGRLHGWAGPLWGRRHRAIPILDDAATISRLRYLLLQGVKEGLVESPREWPGASAVPALLGDMIVVGHWYDRTLETRARRRGLTNVSTEFSERYVVRLTPLPCWRGLTPANLAAMHELLVRDIEREAASRSQRAAGATAVCARDPRERPVAPKTERAPSCHASTPRLRATFRAFYRSFVDAFRGAFFYLRSMFGGPAAVTEIASRFPPGSFPPHLPHVRSSGSSPPWLLASAHRTGDTCERERYVSS
ncbi:MAG TPA: hypothetical protein VL463_05085 [Kofleriaceae bacterium]|jgi:hypothetical protein|nr:hypothetical protein [Kofleriaceae bacterium]